MSQYFTDDLYENIRLIAQARDAEEDKENNPKNSNQINNRLKINAFSAIKDIPKAKFQNALANSRLKTNLDEIDETKIGKMIEITITPKNTRINSQPIKGTLLYILRDDDDFSLVNSIIIKLANGSEEDIPNLRSTYSYIINYPDIIAGGFNKSRKRKSLRRKYNKKSLTRRRRKCKRTLKRKKY